MSSTKKAILFGFLSWLFAFILGFAAYVIHDSNRPLFESIMSVGVALINLFLGIKYFKLVKSNFVKEGLKLGLIWIAINILIDAPLMLFGGPMKIGFTEYLSDIGVTYLMIPTITISLGYFKKQNLNN